jgi:hypothetical protein
VVGYAAHTPDQLREATGRIAGVLSSASGRPGARRPGGGAGPPSAAG